MVSFGSVLVSFGQFQSVLVSLGLSWFVLVCLGLSWSVLVCLGLNCLNLMMNTKVLFDFIRGINFANFAMGKRPYFEKIIVEPFPNWILRG